MCPVCYQSNIRFRNFAEELENNFSKFMQTALHFLHTILIHNITCNRCTEIFDHDKPTAYMIWRQSSYFAVTF